MYEGERVERKNVCVASNRKDEEKPEATNVAIVCIFRQWENYCMSGKDVPFSPHSQ